MADLRELPTAELLTIVKSRHTTYTIEEVEVAREELTRRGINSLFFINSSEEPELFKRNKGDSIRKHLYWWFILFAVGVIVSAITSFKRAGGDLIFSTIPYILGGITGLFFFSFILAAISYLFARMLGRKLSTEQFISVYSVAFGLIVLSRIISFWN